MFSIKLYGFVAEKIIITNIMIINIDIDVELCIKKNYVVQAPSWQLCVRYWKKVGERLFIVLDI